VVLHRDLAVIERVQQLVAEWLAGMGLELKPSKTRITHTLHPHDGNHGFDFLGFRIRQHRVGRNRSGKLVYNGGSILLGYKTIITPSNEALRRHGDAISEVVAAHKAAPQAALISRLNPLIRGWCNYYATVSAKDAFSKMAHITYLKLRSWARFRHHGKSVRWIVSKYWHPERGSWDFSVADGPRLFIHDRTPIVRHVKVQEARSPYDGDWAYWATRLGRHPELPKRVATLLRRQRGKCAHCGLFFTTEDLLEVDHIVPPSFGGDDAYTNLQLLHRHCHDVKSATDGSAHRWPTEVPMSRAKIAGTERRCTRGHASASKRGPPASTTNHHVLHHR
jgi:RNA-directed DNA polymerase